MLSKKKKALIGINKAESFPVERCDEERNLN